MWLSLEAALENVGKVPIVDKDQDEMRYNSQLSVTWRNNPLQNSKKLFVMVKLSCVSTTKTRRQSMTEWRAEHDLLLC